MRALFAVGLVLLAATPVSAQDKPEVEYKVEIDSKTGSKVDPSDGKRKVTVRFRVRRLLDQRLVADIPKEEIIVEEDGQRVRDLVIETPKAQKLTIVLVMDISGSMARANKMAEAKKAALLFLDKLDRRADAGLILFDHQIRVAEKPARSADKQAEHRQKLRRLIEAAKPLGGTAYLDATVEAVRMLEGIEGRKAVVLMTDGVDMSSKRTLKETVRAARKAEVPVYTLGIGEPGKNDQVTTVLVLDHSGSMLGKASEADDRSKIDALKVAAQRFVNLMSRRRGARTTLLPFSTRVGTPEPFTRNESILRQRIADLKAKGGTLLYDATFAGVETLVAAEPKGKKAVVVLTDGKDEAPGSRLSDEMVIERARETGIPLYMLGLGQKHEIAEDVMRRMAKETKGEYYHIGNEKKLVEVFENLSIELHDDGIDEASLKELARKTGGKYTHVSKASELRFIYEQLADELQSTYTVTYPSLRQRDDGTARGIDVKVMRAGKLISTVGKVDDVVRGVVVPQMSAAVYLAFLAVLAGLLAAPATGVPGLRHPRVAGAPSTRGFTTNPPTRGSTAASHHPS
jgi:VWFA-related protein